jgi:hypothetical protein
MSWEAWGATMDDPFDVELLYRRGWDCDESAERWWKLEEPERIYTFAEAVALYEAWSQGE